MPHQISTASTEYVLARVTARVSGGFANPTTNTVQMAFLATQLAPISGDWKSASWETDAVSEPDTYYARCLVGPAGTVTLAAGDYEVWVKITDSPENPVLRCGQLRVV